MIKIRPFTFAGVRPANFLNSLSYEKENESHSVLRVFIRGFMFRRSFRLERTGYLCNAKKRIRKYQRKAWRRLQ
jgi:hypothetical protein